MVVFLLGCTELYPSSYKLCEPPTCQVYNLSNGLTIVLKEDHKAPVVSAQLWVRTGTLNEDRKTNGLSHFLEHILFKPNKKGIRFDDVVESSGGRLNGGTYYDFTYYYATIPSANLNALLQGLANLVFEPAFDPKAVDLEREVVIQEINRTEDLPDHIMDDVFQETLYQVHSYHQRVLGPMGNIKNSPQKVVKDYYDSFYAPNNMILVVVGDIDQNQTIEAIHGIYGKYPHRPVPTIQHAQEPTIQRPRKKEMVKEVQQSYLMLGYRGPSASNPDTYILEVIKGILSEGLSSRLNQHMKEEKKLVSAIGVSFDERKEGSVFAITAEFKLEKEREVEKALLEEIDQLKKELISEEELAKVKRLLVKDHEFGLESTESKAESIGYSMIVANLDLANNEVEAIQDVSSAQVQRVAKEYFTFPTVVVVKPK